MVSTPDDLMSNSPIYVGAVGTQKKLSAIKLLSHFLALLDVKQKKSVQILEADKTKRKSIRTGSVLWSSIHKRRVHTKINEFVKRHFVNGFYIIVRFCSFQ